MRVRGRGLGAHRSRPGRASWAPTSSPTSRGIHADGVIKNPLNYEAYAPEDVGLERQIVVGKHSGSRTIYRKFQEFGIELSEHDASEILKMVRQTAIELKRALFSKEIMYIYQDYIASLAAAADADAARTAPPDADGRAPAPAAAVAATPAARD